jgi:hypothetical protein
LTAARVSRLSRAGYLNESKFSRFVYLHHVRSAYQPPASSAFLSEQTSHQQSANNTILLEQISTSHQPNEQAYSFWFLAS